jgi:type VI protein secretion system component VasK
MLPRTHLRRVLTVSLLCGAAHPAFADGVFPTDDEWNRFLVLVALVFLAAMVVLILLVRGVRAALRSRAARPAAPAVPAARILQDRSKPS